jgi:hypothetical protein
VNTLYFNKILTKTAELGLPTKLQKLAGEVDALRYLEVSMDNVLSLTTTADLSPGVLSLVSTALKAGPLPLFIGAAGSATASAAIVTTVSDNSVQNIALKNTAVIPLRLVLPGALIVGALLISKLK